MLEDTLRSKDAKSNGNFKFEIGARTNGRHILQFDFLVLDENQEVTQEFSMPVSTEESTRLRRETDKTVYGSFSDLLPGRQYNMKVRVVNAVGPSSWSPDSPLVRMPPDVPCEPLPLSSELTSLEFIEVKWKPPIENGAEIDKYEIRLALRPDAIEEEWILIDEEDLKNNTKVQGSDLKKLRYGDQGSYAFRIHGLKDGTTYYFTHRACNCVGCSTWSEVTRFSTKNSKPAKLTDLWQESATSREVTIAWNPPESNGMELMRYDIVGGPNQRVLRWCQFASRLLDATVDADKLFGYAIKEDAEPDVPLGNESFAELYCEDNMYAPVLVPTTSFTLRSLLPGQDYFFIARGVASSGKGEFSQVLGPCRTEPEAPGLVEGMQLEALDNKSCSVTFRLPFSFGSKIEGVHAVLRRTAGPLSLDEFDEDGAVKEHVAGQEIKANPLDLTFIEHVEPPGEEGSGKIIHPGVTAALRRAFGAEGLSEAEPLRRLNTASSFVNCTGRAYRVMFENLRPGTQYEICWSCQNAIGQSSFSSPLQIQTDPAQPDQPPPIAVASL